ncbi:MAG: patatin-like phospholipase family protein [Isosphaeraceae bacterium]
MNDELIPLLKVHEYFQGASDETLEEVVRLGRVVQYPAGSVVHEADVVLTTVGFVLRGRLKAVRVSTSGTESLFRMIERGEQFGLMVGALGESVPIRVVALEPSTVLRLDYEEALELAFARPDLRRLWLKSYAGSLRKFFFGAAPKRSAMMLALIHDSPATRPVAERLIQRLSDVGEQLAVLSDSDQRPVSASVRFRPLREDGRDLTLEEIREQVASWQDANRIIFDVHTYLTPERATRLMGLVDRAVYFMPANAPDSAIRRLQAIDVSARGWRDKISVAWLLQGESSVVPAVPNLSELASRDFKIHETPPKLPAGRSLANGLERLVHDLRGVRVGVALGGGAARGLSHLGVLKALERNGIVVDMIAGTSAGAMTGILYSAGLDPDYNADSFAADLLPSWIFRQLPHGNYWHLLYKYRRGKFDGMLRKYLHDWRLEQLAIPCLSVTVDLVSGNSVVRQRGDAVQAILESINLPVLSVPIVRNGQALIDGGLVNNIPADVLVSMGCNFVIAVSVTAKLETSFCDISPEEPTLSRKNPGIVPTIFRSLLVQNYNLNAFGVQPADVVIEPDATSIDASEFMRAKELAVIGEAAAREQVPKIHRLLNRLDPQLFKPTSDTNESARATTKPAVMAVSLATVSTPARSAFGAGLSIQAGK